MRVSETCINSENDVLNILMERSAILKGHFLLTSGLHTDTYIQCAKLHEVPSVCVLLCEALLKKARASGHEDLLNVDVVASPAIGGLMFGYEIARQLGVNFVFFERVDGCFTLRRGFNVSENAKVLIVEDVVTTGKSSLAVINAVTALGGKIAGELSIVTRAKDVDMPVPVVSLLSLDIKNYREEEVPDFLAQIPISKPGSNFIK
ncbi:orotate phosphoribosyltransferase [Anaplasma phagocytophilum]|nr:orotate phosphoribosyltransferase [Anaplasma phagocytophilum]